jgi:hypothetical protein
MMQHAYIIIIRTVYKTNSGNHKASEKEGKDTHKSNTGGQDTGPASALPSYTSDVKIESQGAMKNHGRALHELPTHIAP